MTDDLQWHPTEEEALANARRIFANLAQIAERMKEADPTSVWYVGDDEKPLRMTSRYKVTVANVETGDKFSMTADFVDPFEWPVITVPKGWNAVSVNRKKVE